MRFSGGEKSIHFVQFEDPGWEEKVPDGQGVQLSNEVLAVPL